MNMTMENPVKRGINQYTKTFIVPLPVVSYKRMAFQRTYLVQNFTDLHNLYISCTQVNVTHAAIQSFTASTNMLSYCEEPF